MSKRICLTVDEVLERVLHGEDQEDDCNDDDDVEGPDEPIMEGSDDDFEDLVEELNEVEEGTQLTVQGLF